MQSASTNDQSQKELARLIDAARVDADQLVTEIQDLLQNKPEALVALFHYILTLKPEAQPLVDMITGADKTTLLNGARRKLEQTTIPARADEIISLKIEMMAAMIAHLMTLSPDAKCFQDMINIVRTYGTYPDCEMLNSAGIQEKTGVVGKARGAIGVLVPKAVLNEDVNTTKIRICTEFLQVIMSPAEPLSTLQHEMKALSTHKRFDKLVSARFRIETQTNKEGFLKLIDSIFKDELLTQNLSLVRNKTLMKSALNIEDCENVMNEMSSTLDVMTDITSSEKLQLYRMMQKIRSLLSEARNRIAEEMLVRLTEYLAKEVIEIDSADAEKTFECPAVEVNLVKTSKGKKEFKPSTINLIKERARQSDQGIDVMSGTDICRCMYYIADAGTDEQRERLLWLQPEMLLTSVMKSLGIEDNPTLRNAFLNGDILPSVVSQPSDLPYLMKLINSVNEFNTGPGTIVKVIHDAHQQKLIDHETFEQFWLCVTAIVEQLNNPTFSLKLLRGMINMSRNSKELITAMTEYIAFNSDSKLKVELTNCLALVTDDLQRLTLFNSFIIITKTIDGENIYEAMLNKFMPEDYHGKYDIVLTCAQICAQIRSYPNTQFILKAIAEAQSLNDMKSFFRQSSECQRLCPLAYYLYAHFPAGELAELLQPLLIDDLAQDKSLFNVCVSMSPIYAQSVTIAERALRETDIRCTMTVAERRELVRKMIAFIQLTKKISSSTFGAEEMLALKDDLQDMIIMAKELHDAGQTTFVNEVMKECATPLAKAGENYLASLIMLATVTDVSVQKLVTTVKTTLTLIQTVQQSKMKGAEIGSIMSNLRSILKEIRICDAAVRDDLIKNYLAVLSTPLDQLDAALTKLMEPIASKRVTNTKAGVFTPNSPRASSASGKQAAAPKPPK